MSAFVEAFRAAADLAPSDHRYAELIASVQSTDLKAVMRELLKHASATVRQAAALAPVLANDRAIGPVLIEALGTGPRPRAPLLDEGRRTFARLTELGTSDPVLGALASTALMNTRGIDDRESWGAAVQILSRTDPHGLCVFAERWLLAQVSLSSSTHSRSRPGVEYDGLAFDPDFRGPYLYSALAELAVLPESLIRLLTHISHGGFRRGYTAMFPLAAKGDARALEWLGRALEWIPPGALVALGSSIVPYLVETLSRRHSGVGYAFAALEAMDAAKAEREKFVREILEELRLAPPGHELTRSIELLSAAACALTGDQIWSLLQMRVRELDRHQLTRMLELLARAKDPRLEPFLVERAKERDGAAMLFLAQLGGREAEQLVEALEEKAGDRAGREAWCYLARHLPHPPRVVIEHALATCHPTELLPILARAGTHGVRAIMAELGAVEAGGPVRSTRLWDEVGPGVLLETLRVLAESADCRIALLGYVDHPDIRAALLAREALCDAPREVREEPRPFTMEWARAFRARAALRRPSGSIFLNATSRGAPARA